MISVSGPKSLDARFPGQWFQFEAGLHANWHRTYDPTLGRYLEADPLGFPDGPNRYAYVGSSPLMDVDPEGKHAILVRIVAGAVAAAAVNLASQLLMNGGDLSCVSWEDVIISGIPGRSRKGGSRGADSPPAIASPTPPKHGVNDPPVHNPGKTPDFVVSPDGTAFPVPSGAQGPVPVVNSAGKQTGVAYTGGSGGAVDSRVNRIRIMNPTPPRGSSPGYPNGYIKYENANGQGVNPLTGRTVPNSQSHYPIQ